MKNKKLGFPGGFSAVQGSMATIQKIRRLYQTGKYKQAYFATGVSSPQIGGLVNFKRRMNS